MKFNRKNPLLLATLSLTLTAHQASGVVKTWIGGTADWGTAGNWSVSGVPATTDDAVFTSTGSAGVYLGTAARTIKSITFDATTSAAPYTINLRESATVTTVRALTVGAGGITVSAGNHTIKGAGVINLPAELLLTTASAFNVAAGATLNFEAKLGGASSNALSKTGLGTLVIKQNNGGTSSWNLTGGLFTVAAGTLDLALSGASGNSGNKYSVTNGGTLKISTSGGWSSNAGSLTLNGTTSTSGALYASATSSLSPTTLALASTSSIGVDAAQTLTMGSAISGVGGLTKVGDGTLSLNGANTYTGNTLVSAGRIFMGNALALQNSAYDTASVSGGLDLNGSTTPTLGGLTGSVNLSSTLITGYGSISNLTLNPQTGISSNYSGDVGNGAGGMILTKSGAGTQILSGANTYTGTTSITAGTLALGNLNALGTTPGTNGTSGISIAAGSALQSNTVGGSTIAAAITLVTGGDTNLRIGQGAASTTHTFNVNGAIGGATGNLVYSTGTANFGNGTSLFVLGAAGNYTGNTLITSGNGANNPVTVRNGIVNALPVTTVLTLDGGTGGGTGRNIVFDLNGNNQTLAGLTNVTSLSLRRQIVTSATAATLTINNTDPYSFGGSVTSTSTTSTQIQGAIALTKSGTGTLTLGGPLVGGASAPGNTFTGDTKILGGILVLGETISLQNSAFDTTNSITGDATNGLRSTVTTLTLGGLTGNKNLADVFTTTAGGYTAGLTALTLNNGTGATSLYSGAIANGATGMTLTKIGAGTQVLSGANSYTGTTTGSAGVLLATQATALPGYTVAGQVIFNGATIGAQVGGSGWTTGEVDTLLANATKTSGALGIDTTNGNLTQWTPFTTTNFGTTLGLNKLGANNLTLDQANTYTGPTTVTAGTLTLANPLALQNSALGITGTGSVVLSGLTTLNLGGLNGAASYVNFSGVTALTFNPQLGVSATYGGDIPDGAVGMTVTKTGAGSQALTGTNSYTGITTVNEGTLRFGKQASLYNGTTGSWTAANINVKSAATLAVNVDSAGTAGFDNTNLDTLLTNISVANTAVQGLQSGAILGFDTGTAAGGTFTQGNVIADSTGANGGVIGVTKLGTGFFVLDKTNTYTGLTTVNGGALRITVGGALGTTAAGTVVNGTNTGNAANARLDLSGGITVTGETATLSGVGDFFGAMTSSSGVNEWAGNVTIGAALTRLGASAGATLKVSGVIDSGVVNTGLDIRGADSTSTVILSGANTYLGDTNLIIGKLQLDGGNNRLPVAAKFAMGNAANTVEFDLNGRSQEIAGLSIISGATAANNSVNNSDLVNLSTLTVKTATASPSTFAGILKGNLALTKTGPETLTITGNNTYTGETKVSEGTLAIATGYLSSLTPVNVASGAFLTTNRNNTFSGGSAAVPSGAWTIAGTITQTAAGSTMPANVTLNNGTMSGTFKADFGPFLAAGSGTTITANGTTNTIDAGNLGLFAGLTVDTPLAPDALAISSQLGGTSALAGGLTKNGLGTVTLTGASTFSGNITVENGTLVGAGATNSPGITVFGNRLNTRTITVNNGGTLQFNSGNILGSNHTATTAPTLVINSGGVVTNGSIATNNALNNVQLNDGTLTSTTGHTGSTPPNLPVYGAWNLNGSVTSTGNSTISTSDPTKGWIMLKVVGDKTTDFNVTGGTLTVSAPVVDNPDDSNIGALSKSGAGVMILSGVNTYTGNTTVTAGTLALADNAQLKFVLGATSGTNNSLTGSGTATLDGDFVIDTTAANALPSGSWLLENVNTLTAGAYGSTFSVVGFTNAGGDKWTKANGLATYTFDEATGVLTLTPGGFSSWITGTFAGGATVPLDKRGPYDDPDNDGISNLVEYAVAGQDPTVANSSIGTFNGTTLSFSKRADASGLTYAIQDSTDLGTADAWAEVTGIPPVYVNDGTTISYTLTPGTPAKNFLRLQVLSN